MKTDIAGDIFTLTRPLLQMRGTVFLITQYKKAQEYLGMYTSKMQMIHEKFLNTRQTICTPTLFLGIYNLGPPLHSIYFVCYFMSISIPSLALFIF